MFKLKMLSFLIIIFMILTNFIIIWTLKDFFFIRLYYTRISTADVIFYKSINLKEIKKISSIIVHTNKTMTMRLIQFFFIDIDIIIHYTFIFIARYYVSFPHSLCVYHHIHIIIYDNIFIEWFPSKYDGKVYRYFIYIVHTHIILWTRVLYYNTVISFALTARVLRVETTKSARHLTVSFLYTSVPQTSAHITSPVQLSYSYPV